MLVSVFSTIIVILVIFLAVIKCDWLFPSNGPPGSERIRLTLDGGVVVKGELLFKCFHKKTATNSDSIFRVQFHSSVVEDYAISFSKHELDDAFRGRVIFWCTNCV